MQNEDNSSDTLQRVNAVYGQLSSYQDRGIATVCFHPGTEKEWIKEYSFHTLFKRPAYFCLAWSESNQPNSETYYVVRRNSEVKSKGRYGQTAQTSGRSNDGLLKALMSAEQSLLFIPHMIILGSHRQITSLRDATINRTTNDSGDVCLEIAGSFAPRTEVKLTVSNANYLIRAIATSSIHSEEFFETLEQSRFKSIHAFFKWMSLNKYSRKELAKKEHIAYDRPQSFRTETTVKYDMVMLNEPIGDDEFLSER